MKYTYGTSGVTYELEAPNNLTAYAAMILHCRDSDNHNGFSSDQKLKDKIDNVYGGPGEFKRYFIRKRKEIFKAYQTIKHRQ